jgi:hypothetical protein
MSRAGQRPAELATVIARAASFGGPAVAFAILHLPREHLTPLATPPSTGISGICRETLAFDLPPAGFRMYTGFADSPASTMAGLGKVTPMPCAGGQLYKGTASLNPRFLYDSAQDHELLLSVGEDRWAPDFADSLLLVEVLARLAAAAADRATAAPILLMQSPVAPFSDWAAFPQSHSGEPPKISRGAAIRMSAGVDGDNSDGRLALIEEAVRIATTYGLRLHLGDRRVGRVRGEWKQAVAYSSETYQDKKRGLTQTPTTKPDHAMLVTFVGPARVGSSASVLRALADRQVGVLAITVASLQELAFINLVVPLPPRDSGEPLPESDRVQPVPAAIDWLASRCALRQTSVAQPVHPARAADYQACLTGPLHWPTDAACDDHPLWMQWETPAGDDKWSSVIHEVIGEVIGELTSSPKVESAQLDYCRSRLTGDKWLHSAKVSVRLVTDIADDDLPDTLSVLCRATQAEVEWKMSRKDPTARSIRLKVAWRERWLARIRSTGVP